MTRHFRTYDRAWSRTGWSEQPQYPGQSPTTRDFPTRCHCGASFNRVARDLSSEILVYVATCTAGHDTPDQPVSSLIEAAQ
jgi:hypothetical protein